MAPEVPELAPKAPLYRELTREVPELVPEASFFRELTPEEPKPKTFFAHSEVFEGKSAVHLEDRQAANEASRHGNGGDFFDSGCSGRCSRPGSRPFDSPEPLFPSLSYPSRSFSGAILNLSDVQKISALKTRATSSEETSSSFETEELLADLKQKWDAIENKSTVFVYGGGAIVALWLSSILIGAINSVPLLPKILELVGLGYTGWFVYRYLLFKSSRKELAEDIESLKKKIAGTE
ncbi:protein CURVATURE THYLAKOID 1A, chloroplastic-like [Phalaenopsis equestris]|uniref:protein CURVATURE THYLAKOID 1A, chloroplastic-like n=1 Tax=Phalaenopsis equestris TaxID=78828 RepID=UPI0009E1F5C2|nr:protein CURVATURE THYLAKOID 1A, chloroplastic-like [Phalaenopsis equestris]